MQAAALALAATDAAAQSAPDSPFKPTLTDPRSTQRFQTTAPTARSTAATATPAIIPSGAGETGFDMTGALAKKKKAKKARPGDPKPPPPPPPKPPGPPQFDGGHTLAPQIPARAPYAEAYKPPDAPPRRPPPSVQDAFEPIGIRAGTFLLRPSIDYTRGYDSNPARRPGQPSSGYNLYEAALKAKSEWSRHELGADLRGSYSEYDSLTSSDRPMVDAKVYGRYDVSRDTALNAEARYFLSTDYPGSPNIPADIAKLPIYTTIGGSVGFVQRFNRLEIAAKAIADHTVYQESKLTDGSTSSNHDRDYDQFGGQVRASYEVFPGVKPFVEIAGDTRQHQEKLDRNGFARDSKSLTPRVGTTFEISKKLTGDVSVGYVNREYDDPALTPLRGMVFDASLTYIATGLTTVTLTANSRADELVVAGESGVLRRDLGIQVDHAFRRWLIGTLRFGYGNDEYFGSIRADNRMSLGSAITYKLNRDLWLKGEYRYEQLRSNVSDVDYNANIFLVGVKLQR